MTDTPIRVGLYLRVSTAHQAATGISLEEQEYRLRQGVARRPGWTVVRVYRDDGYSGHDLDRPDVRRCLNDVAAGELDVLYALDVDRAHRNERNRRNFEAVLEDHGVDMVYELEPEFDRLSMKHLSRGMKGIIAEYYSDWASETTRDKMIYMASREKRRTGGPIPFGLAVDENKQYVEDPQWFPTLVEIFRRYANGESVRAIARWLDGQGVPTPGLLDYQRNPTDGRGRPKRRPSGDWTRYTVERILRNEAYHGTLVYNRSYGKRHGFTPKDPTEHVRVENAWTKFIDDVLWYRVRARNEEVATPSLGAVSRNTFALSRITCRRCGHSMHGYTVSKYKDIVATGERKHYRYRLYRCTGRSNSASCDAPMIPAERLERLVIDAVAGHLLEDREALERMYREGLKWLRHVRQNAERALEVGEEAIQELIGRRARLVDSYAQSVGQASPELLKQLDARIVALGDVIEDRRAQQAAHRETLRRMPIAEEKLRNMHTDLETIPQRLREANLSMRRQLLDVLVERLEVDPDACMATITMRQLLAAGPLEEPLGSWYTPQGLDEHPSDPTLCEYMKGAPTGARVDPRSRTTITLQVSLA